MDKMKLRDHPLMTYKDVKDVRSWPPARLWRGGYETTHPHGEVGILKEVIPSTVASYNSCFLIMEHCGAEYIGVLLLSDPAFCRQIHGRRARGGIEETVFYPALEQHEELKDMVAEALKEHQEVKTLLEEIEELGSGSHDFRGKLQEMMEGVEHHVAEEEGEMFPKVREVFDERELDELGTQLNSAKGVQQREAV
jgi:hypothetical protein